jgi:hypothetical protein
VDGSSPFYKAVGDERDYALAKSPVVGHSSFIRQRVKLFVHYSFGGKNKTLRLPLNLDGGL